MASIHKEIATAAGPDDVWDAVSGSGALHEAMTHGAAAMKATLDG
jgi:hypothetical protein